MSTTSPSSRSGGDSRSLPPSPPTPRSSPCSSHVRWRRDWTMTMPSGAPSAPSTARSPSPLTPPASRTGSCSPCAGAASRSTWGWLTTPTSSPASHTGWSRSLRPTCAWTATCSRRQALAVRSSCSTAPRPARSRASPGWRTTEPSSRCRPTSSPTPRSPLATSTVDRFRTSSSRS